MARYSISDTTLTALGDAVRSKVGETRKEEVTITETHNKTIGTGVSEGASIFQISNTTTSGKTRLKMVEEIPEGITTEVDADGVWTTFEFDENNEYIVNDYSFNFRIRNRGNEPWSYTLIVTALDSEGNEATKLVDVSNTLTPIEMADKISNLQAIPEEALFLTGNCSYRFSQDSWNWFIEQCGDKITTQDISSLANMFSSSTTLQEIPFSIYLSSSYITYHPTSSMFQNCNKLIKIPMIYLLKAQDMTNMFSGCSSISSFPENFAKDWDWSRLDNATSAYTGTMSNLFSNCMKLREIPQELLIHGNPFWTYTYTLTNGGFNNCYSLEKVENVFIPYKSTAMTASYSNAFGSMVKNCCRLKKLTLQTQQDGTPYDVSGWKYQTIDLSTVGYGSISNMRVAGLTEETKIDNEEKWRGYINGSYPDGWAGSVEYSTFGATAVKEFIASLPSITGGSNNTIKLKQGAASAIPGEEMTSLTEEDIAVATEKGWTITFA